MYQILREFKRRLESSKSSGPYWIMSKELLPALNNARHNPVFFVRSEKICVVNAVFWKALARERYITFPGFDEFKIPQSVIRSLEINPDDYLVLFIGWCALNPEVRTDLTDKTHRLAEVVFIAKKNIRFPVKERYEMFEKILNASKILSEERTQGNLNVKKIAAPDFKEWDYVIRRKFYLFFNHILSGDLFLIRKDNQIILTSNSHIEIFSWDHPKSTITLPRGTYLLYHPFPRGFID